MKKALALLLLFSLLQLTSCLHHQYLPNTHSQPMLTKKGDQRFLGTLNSHNFAQSGDLQYARAVNDQYGLLVNGMWTLSSQDSSLLRGVHLEAAGGRFWYRPTKFAEPQNPDGVVTEVYVGAGWGTYFNRYVDGDGSGFIIFPPPPMPTVPIVGTSRLHYSKWFVQPSIGYLSSILELGFSARLAYLNFFSGQFAGNDPEGKKIYRRILEKNDYFIFEPAATIRLGLGKVKLQGQLGYTSVPAILSPKFFLSFGFNYAIRK